MLRLFQAGEIIKAALKILLILSFGFSVQFLFLFLVFAIGGFTPAFLKDTLVKSNVYGTVSSKIESLAIESSDSEDMIMPFIKEQFTSSYVRGKSETLIDDTFSWLDGKTSTPPVLSFKELKDSIEQKNPELISQLQQMSVEMKQQQQEQAMQEGGLPTSQTDSMDFNKMMKSDFSIPVGENLKPLKSIYAFFKFALPLTAVYLLVLLGLIALLSSGVKSKLKWIGATFISSIFFCCLPIVIAIGLSKAPLQFDVKSPEISGIISSISTIVVRAFAEKYLQVEVLGVMAFVAFGVICFIASSMVTSTTQAKTSVSKKRKTS